MKIPLSLGYGQYSLSLSRDKRVSRERWRPHRAALATCSAETRRIDIVNANVGYFELRPREVWPQAQEELYDVVFRDTVLYHDYLLQVPIIEREWQKDFRIANSDHDFFRESIQYGFSLLTVLHRSNTGLGLAAAIHIARLKPARLILAVRNLTSGAKARDTIISSTGIDPSAVEVWHLDMSSFAMTLSFADRCTKDLGRLDGISLNAGIQTGTFELMEGYESTITVNVISTFLLFFAMLPLLKASAEKYKTAPRISVVSSETHAWAPFLEKDTPSDQSILTAFSTPNPKTGGKNVDRLNQYSNSKLLEVLIFRYIYPILEQKGYEHVIMNILNPGLCHSDIGRDESMVFRTVKYFAMAVFARSAEVGGRTLASALMPDKSMDGQYLHDGVVAEEMLSTYVMSENGRAMGERLWKEVKDILERARPGVTIGC